MSTQITQVLTIVEEEPVEFQSAEEEDSGSAKLTVADLWIEIGEQPGL